ncbi:MAG: acyl carrier protein [Magnetococcales bacterium]|nr:acyl carrier protein [Magnetococcales bacterium]
MDGNADLETLRTIFRLALDLPDDADVSEIRRLNHPRWDSLAHTSLCFAIESEFGFALSVEEMEEVASLESAWWIVEERRGGG